MLSQGARMSDRTFIHEAADKLFVAEQTATPIAPLSSLKNELSENDAYDIQLTNTARHIREGKRVVGYKIGLTSRELQQKFGVGEPDFGHLLDGMAVDQEGEIDLSTLISPRIEGELAFVMAKDLKGPGVTVNQTIAAVDSVIVAMEIVDSRICDWKLKHADLVADNGVSCRFVLSGAKHLIDGKDFATMGMVVYRNGEVWDTGAGSAVMGNPLTALTLLTNKLGLHDRGLKAGEVVLSGAFGALIPVQTGDYYRCEIGRLGSTGVRFIGGRKGGAL